MVRPGRLVSSAAASADAILELGVCEAASVGRWLPKFFVVVAVVSVVSNAARGHPVYGLAIGAPWLVAAFVAHRRRARSPGSADRPS